MVKCSYASCSSGMSSGRSGTVEVHVLVAAVEAVALEVVVTVVVIDTVVATTVVAATTTVVAIQV